MATPTKDQTINIKDVNKLSTSADDIRKFGDLISKDLDRIMSIVNAIPDYWKSEFMNTLIGRVQDMVNKGKNGGDGLIKLNDSIKNFALFLDKAYEVRTGTEKKNVYAAGGNASKFK